MSVVHLALYVFTTELIVLIMCMICTPCTSPYMLQLTSMVLDTVVGYWNLPLACIACISDANLSVS